MIVINNISLSNSNFTFAHYSINISAKADTYFNCHSQPYGLTESPHLYLLGLVVSWVQSMALIKFKWNFVLNHLWTKSVVWKGWASFWSFSMWGPFEPIIWSHYIICTPKWALLDAGNQHMKWSCDFIGSQFVLSSFCPSGIMSSKYGANKVQVKLCFEPSLNQRCCMKGLSIILIIFSMRSIWTNNWIPLHYLYPKMGTPWCRKSTYEMIMWLCRFTICAELILTSLKWNFALKY